MHWGKLANYDTWILQNKECIMWYCVFLGVKFVSLPYSWHIPAVTMMYVGI